jgi:hypothetical protein
MILVQRMHQITNLSRHDWIDLLLAAWDLGTAAISLSSAAARPIRRDDLNAVNRRATLTPVQEIQVARAASAIARASRVVPWRSDCLRQAEAGRRWLRRRGVVAELYLGARRDPSGALNIHAWLIAGDKVVTGGDIALFTPFG